MFIKTVTEKLKYLSAGATENSNYYNDDDNSINLAFIKSTNV